MLRPLGTMRSCQDGSSLDFLLPSSGCDAGIQFDTRLTQVQCVEIVHFIGVRSASSSCESHRTGEAGDGQLVDLTDDVGGHGWQGRRSVLRSIRTSVQVCDTVWLVQTRGDALCIHRVLAAPQHRSFTRPWEGDTRR